MLVIDPVDSDSDDQVSCDHEPISCHSLQLVETTLVAKSPRHISILVRTSQSVHVILFLFAVFFFSSLACWSVKSNTTVRVREKPDEQLGSTGGLLIEIRRQDKT